jgi:SAM-dependent methyltransferase
MEKKEGRWFETFFTGMAVEFWRRALPPEHTKAEVDFIEAELGGTTVERAHAKWLDVPCGHGRHAIELARRGHAVVGIDLCAEEIAEAKRRAKGVSNVEFREGDMRDLQLEGLFSGAYCFGNSFGYLEYAEMENFLRKISDALLPGARFLVNTGMTAESVLPNFKEREWYELGDILVTMENRYLPTESCAETDFTFLREGKREARRDHHSVYTVAELRRLLGRAGFRVTELFGSVDRKPFALGSTELFVVAVKNSGP